MLQKGWIINQAERGPGLPFSPLSFPLEKFEQGGKLSITPRARGAAGFVHQQQTLINHLILHLRIQSPALLHSHCLFIFICLNSWRCPSLQKGLKTQPRVVFLLTHCINCLPGLPLISFSLIICTERFVTVPLLILPLDFHSFIGFWRAAAPSHQELGEFSLWSSQARNETHISLLSLLIAQPLTLFTKAFV